MRYFLSKVVSTEDLSQPNLAHAIVSATCRVVEGGRPLFRHCEGPNGQWLLVQTIAKPEFSLVRGLRTETKELEFTPATGSTYRFKLKANPTFKLEDRRRMGILGQDGQLKWLTEALRGAKVLDAGAQPEGLFKVPDRGSIYSVVFEGLLEVTDARQFERTRFFGVGDSKAYGYGMLTLRLP